MKGIIPLYDRNNLEKNEPLKGIFQGLDPNSDEAFSRAFEFERNGSFYCWDCYRKVDGSSPRDKEQYNRCNRCADIKRKNPQFDFSEIALPEDMAEAELYSEILGTRFPCNKCGKQTRWEHRDKLSKSKHNQDLCPDCGYQERLLIIPRKYRDADLNRDCNNFTHASHQSLYIYGLPGRGKTYLALALVIEGIKQGKDVEVIWFTQFMSECRHSISFDNGATTYKLKKRAKDVELLLVDDLGGLRSSTATDFEVNTMFEILDHRVNHELPLIVTSNKSLNELMRDFDQRIASRLTGICRQVNLKGQDRRIKASSSKQAGSSTVYYAEQ